MINKAKTLIISSSTLENNGERTFNVFEHLPQLFLGLNLFFLCIYTTCTANSPIVMMVSHAIGILIWATITWMAIRGSKNKNWSSDPLDIKIIRFSTERQTLACVLVAVTLFIQTPLRAYASGPNKCSLLLVLYQLSSSLLFVPGSIWIVTCGLLFGCVAHSPYVTSVGITREDLWMLLLVGGLVLALCHWFNLRTKVLKDISHSKDMFLSNIGHEIRTPLHGILGSIDALRMEVENLMVDTKKNATKVLEWLEVMHGCAISLSEILDNMILLSKLDSTVSIATTPSAKEEFPLRPFLKEIYHLAIAYPKAPGVIFRYFIDEKVPQVCVADRIGLRQILTNLVTNGLKFTTNGNVVLRVFPHTVQKCTLCFELSDTGCGMSQQFMKKIFSPFAQEDPTPSRAQRGAGLGLFISATIAHRMGANIAVKSQKGLGTTMCLNLVQPERVFNILPRVQSIGGLPTNFSLPPHISASILARRRHTLPFADFKRSGSFVAPPDMHTSVTPMVSPAQRYPDFLQNGENDERKLSAIQEEAESVPIDPRFRGLPPVSRRGMYNINYDELDPEEDLNADQSDTTSTRSADDVPDTTDILPEDKHDATEKGITPTATEKDSTSSPKDFTPTNRHKNTKDSPPPTINTNKEDDKPDANNNNTKDNANSSNNDTVDNDVPLALIVDDNPINVKVLHHHLSTTGFNVRSVVNGEDAIEEAIKTRFDIVFLDVYMPGMGGIEAARQISKLPTPPRLIVGCSADTRGSVIAECKAAGMTEFLPKPFKKQVIAQLYSSILILKQVEKENLSNSAELMQMQTGVSSVNSEDCVDKTLDNTGVIGDNSVANFVDEMQKVAFKISQENISTKMNQEPHE